MVNATNVIQILHVHEYNKHNHAMYNLINYIFLVRR